MPRRVDAAGGDRRFDDEVTVVGQPHVIAGAQHGRGDHRDAGTGQLVQIGLVGAPREHVGCVAYAGDRRRRLGPGEEFVASQCIVPGRPDDGEVVRGPVRGCVVPGHDVRFGSRFDQRSQQQRIVLVGAHGRVSRDNGDAGQLAVTA